MYVHNLSAVGEQYLDFEPADDKGPVRRGRRHAARQRGLAARRRGRPAGRAELVRRARSTRRTSRSWSASSGRCSTTPASRCSSCSTTARTFIDEASAHTAETRALLDDGLTVLQTQEGEGENIRAFSRDLARITESLKDSDADLRTTLSDTPATAREVDRLLTDLEPTLPVLLGQRDQRRPGRVSAPRRARAAAGGLPARDRERLHRHHRATATATSTCSSTRSVQPCTKGYKPPDQWRPPSRPLRRPDLPGPVHRRAAVRPARHAVLARRPARQPGRGLPRAATTPRPASSTAWSTRTATRCTSVTRATSRCSATTRGSGCWSARWWPLLEPSRR